MSVSHTYHVRILCVRVYFFYAYLMRIIRERITRAYFFMRIFFMRILCVSYARIFLCVSFCACHSTYLMRINYAYVSRVCANTVSCMFLPWVFFWEITSSYLPDQFDSFTVKQQTQTITITMLQWFMCRPAIQTSFLSGCPDGGYLVLKVDSFPLMTIRLVCHWHWQSVTNICMLSVRRIAREQ